MKITKSKAKSEICVWCGYESNNIGNMRSNHGNRCKLNPYNTRVKKTYEIKICPFCSKEGGGPNMGRYHFDNCKFKNKILI